MELINDKDHVLQILEIAKATVSNINSDSEVKDRLTKLSVKVRFLHSFIYCYTFLEDNSIDADDEIINWTASDVWYDLTSSIWNLGSGFYKTSASCQRGALEMAAVTLYFQRQQNEDKSTSVYKKDFGKWDSGADSTPSWGTTKPLLKKLSSVTSFTKENGFCPIENAHKHFKYLCSFTHSRAYSPEDGKGTNSMNMEGYAGGFNREEFQRLASAFDSTIAEIASIWAISFPQMVNEWRNNDGESFLTIEELFCTPNSRMVLAFAKEIPKGSPS